MSMATPILTTKLYVPQPRPEVIPRPHLVERLNSGLHCKLTLVSAPAGFGKTTLVSEWLAGCGQPVAWLSLDEGDNNPVHFLTYIVAALQTIGVDAAGVLGALQSPQPPPVEAILKVLLNEIAACDRRFILVLDDYHAIDASAVDNALKVLLERQPEQMHLVIATREDPNLPLARLRVGGQLNELRVADLCFTLSEAEDFFKRGMGLNLSAEDVAALEARTEGWIAGLQLAALALQGTNAATSGSGTAGGSGTAAFIKSFTGSHHFVMDYLMEEVLNQQPETVQTFLLHTSVLERLCAPLCDAVLGWDAAQQSDATASAQQTLEFLLHANLFVFPLDSQRCWFRYHHLFADLLRQRLQQNFPALPDEIHRRASAWYEGNGMEIEAFQHAVAANDVERAARLMEGRGMPLHFRGAVLPVLNWLGSLPAPVLDARPALWVMYASALSMTGQINGVEEKLRAAETALQVGEEDAKTRNLIGHIAAIRALLAATQYRVEDIISQSQRALEYLHPDNLPVRTATVWKLGIAYQLKRDCGAASQAYREAIAISQASGNTMIGASAAVGLGDVLEMENQLFDAAESYRRATQLLGDAFQPVICLAHLGLAHISYEWNDLDAAEQYGQKCLQFSQHMESIGAFAACQVVLARLRLLRGEADQAAEMLDQACQFAHQHHFDAFLPEITEVQVLTLLQQGQREAAVSLAEERAYPRSRARVHLAQGEVSAALALLQPVRQQAQGKGWKDELLKALVLQAIAFFANRETEKAVQTLAQALTLAEAGGFVRTFLDEGEVMARLLSIVAQREVMPKSVARLMAEMEKGKREEVGESLPVRHLSLPEPLSKRELEVLRLIAQGLSNYEIGERLFLALSTVKGHNREIFAKLQARRRSEAIARARELGLL